MIFIGRASGGSSPVYPPTIRRSISGRTAPVALFAEPFERAARRGVAVLALVLIGALVTTVA